MPLDLQFDAIPDKDVVPYAEGVLDALDALDYGFDCDETGPPDVRGEVTYKVFGVFLKAEARSTPSPANRAALLMYAKKGEELSLMLPPGTYYLVDPCYVLRDSIYRAVGDWVFPDMKVSGNSVYMSFSLKSGDDAYLVDFRTAHGDGRFRAAYADGRKFELPVDSGGLAVVDARLCNPGKLAQAVDQGYAAPIDLKETTGVTVFESNLEVGGILTLKTG